MSEVAGVLLEQPNTLILSGVLDYSTGPQLRSEGVQLLGQLSAAELEIDCSGVTHSSSVGLSLLLVFMREAQAKQRTLRIRGLPDEMREIAQVSGLEEILPLVE